MLSRKLSLELLEKGCILFGEFKLSSGGSSPYYIDLRRVCSYPELLDLTLEAYLQVVRGLEFDRVAGIATAGIPLACLLAYRLRKPFLYVRKREKPHGTERTVEGEIQKGDLVLLVDDVATSGQNLLMATETLREQGAQVRDATVLVDREQGAEERLKRGNISLHSFMRVTQLFKELHEAGRLSDRQLENLLIYVKGEHVQG